MDRFITFLFLFLAVWCPAQQTVTVSGRVFDESSGETLIGATALNPSQGAGSATNEYGFYSIAVPARDSVRLVFSYVGFQSRTFELFLLRDTAINVGLSTGVQLEEVVVKANSYQEQLNSTEMSVEAITTREAILIPVLLGDSDILKTV